MKSIHSIIGVALLLAVATSDNSVAQSSPVESSKPVETGLPAGKTAEQVYANIRALTGVPYGEVISGMQVMSESLGVDCEHCHSASGDRDIEGHPNKDVARDMIRMVRDLNQRQFGGRNVISCYTCHRGRAVPEATFSLARADAAEVPATAAQAVPSVRQVIDKYVAALGGAAALQKNLTRVEEGSLTILSNRNQVVPIQIFSQAPDKRHTSGFTVSHLGNSAQAFGVVNGAQGWMRESNGPVRWMFAWRRDAAQLEDLLNLPRRIGQLLPNLRAARHETIGGREAVVLSGGTEFLSLVELAFDSGTGLLLRTQYFVDSVAGRMPSRIDYSDYRDVDGVKAPFHWEVTLVRGVRVSYQVTSVKQNVVVDAAQFALPTPPPSLYR